MLTFINPNELFFFFKNKWLVSNLGRVYSLAKDRFLKLESNTDGYLKFMEVVSKKNELRKRKVWYVHLKVINLFGDCNGNFKNSKETLQVDHIDGDKQNNSISNLELVTQQENTRRFWENGKRKSIEIDKELFG